MGKRKTKQNQTHGEDKLQVFRIELLLFISDTHLIHLIIYIRLHAILDKFCLPVSFICVPENFRTFLCFHNGDVEIAFWLNALKRNVQAFI